MAEDRVSASSSSSSLFTLNRPKGLRGAEGGRERAGEAALPRRSPGSARPAGGQVRAPGPRSPEAVQQVQHYGHHVHGQPHQQPQRALEGLHERVQRAPGNLLRGQTVSAARAPPGPHPTPPGPCSPS